MSDVTPDLLGTESKPTSGTSPTSTTTSPSGSGSSSTVNITGAGGLTFHLSFDTSVSNAPAGFVTAIEDVASFFANQLKDPITVNLDVGWGEVNGQTMGSGALGQSWYYYASPVTYSQIRSDLSAKAASSDDSSAVASLPSTDPTGGGGFIMTTAQAKALGLSSSTGVDGYIGLSSGVTWALDPNNRAVAGEYDLFGTAAHEITEVLGRMALLGSAAGSTSHAYSVLDLFRYAGAGTRDLVAGQSAYFSPNGGTTNLDNFNTSSGGDAGDWASSAGNDSFLAFSGSGVENLVTESDLRELDVMGWNLTSPYTGVFSANGSILATGSSGSLVTNAGTWTFSTTTGAGGDLILLNGQSVWAGSAVQLEVANGSNLYADNSQGQWSEWNGSGWIATTNPSASPPPPTSSLSPDGSILMAGSGGSLVTSAGTWTFGTATDAYGNSILQNGQSAGNGYSAELEVANQGNLYAGSNGQWWEWNGSSWVGSAAPPATTPTPSPTLSPDGSILMAGSAGSLVTSAGTWTFGTATDAYGNSILLNGHSAGSGYSTELEVANQGNVYAGSNGQWWEWNGSSWIGSAAPPTTTTLSPDGSILMAGSGGSVITSAGSWSFGAATDAYGNSILLNGKAAGNGYSTELEVANQGHMYAGSGGQWWEWNGSGWIVSAAPSSTPSAAMAISPDGSVLMAGIGGSLVTSAGSWSFGAATDPYGNNILLNGQSAGNGYSTELEVANQGNVYAGSNGQWWEWSGSGWAVSAAPTSTVSSDGSVLMPVSGGSLLTSAGTWSFGTATDAYGNSILLNGQAAGNGYSTELEVANQGNVYAGSNGQWWEWNGSSWIGSTAPPTTITPSPDGSVLMAGSGGSLVTGAGSWSFGTATDPYGNSILLNGQSAGNGYSTELEVANQGNVYAGSNGQWWEWNGSSWAPSTDPSAGPVNNGNILTVGPGQQYSTISAAIAASQNGDTIQVQAGTYTNDFATINTNITLQGVGGMVNMVGTEQIPNGKAMLVTNGNDTINNFSFSGAQVADANGAGIRYQAGDLILNNDYFHDNQEGLLSAPNPTGTIAINNTEFDHNGIGDGFTHNLYVGDIATLTIDNSYFHDAVVGHEIKSRAENTIIENSRIQDEPTGTASYSIDLPNGGNALIQNNVIEQGPLTQNPVIITSGEEGGVYANSSLQVVNNEILNDFLSPSALAVRNGTSAVAQITGNEFYGLSSGQIASGPFTLSGNTFLGTEPTLITSHPWLG